jgi:hypothetical protein
LAKAENGQVVSGDAAKNGKSLRIGASFVRIEKLGIGLSETV